jgi:hypothetical protein
MSDDDRWAPCCRCGRTCNRYAGFFVPAGGGGERPLCPRCFREAEAKPPNAVTLDHHVYLGAALIVLVLLGLAWIF